LGEKQGENAQSRAQSAQSSGQTPRRSRANSSNTQARQDQAKNTKNDLEDALDDLNRSTNRLRRKFDATDKWMETKAQVEQMVDDGRRINQGSRQLRNSGATLLWGAAKGHQ
jgi:hypothetical protein